MTENLIIMVIIVFALFNIGENFIWHRKAECHLWCFFKEVKFPTGKYAAIGQGLAVRLEWDERLQAFKEFQVFESSPKIGNDEIRNILLLEGEWLGKEQGVTRQNCDSELRLEIFQILDRQMLKVASV